MPLNDSLYQFDWYARLQGDLHPEIEGAGESVDALLAAHAGGRPIFVAEEILTELPGSWEPVPPLWRLKP